MCCPELQCKAALQQLTTNPQKQGVKGANVKRTRVSKFGKAHSVAKGCKAVQGMQLKKKMAEKFFHDLMRLLLDKRRAKRFPSVAWCHKHNHKCPCNGVNAAGMPNTAQTAHNDGDEHGDLGL